MSSRSLRHHTIITALTREPLTRSQLLAHLESCCQRTLQADIKALQQRFPGRLQEQRQGRELLYTWQGPAPHPLHTPIDNLDHNELMSLVAARGLFRNPADHGFNGPLDGAINHLLQQMGLADAAHSIDPQAIEVDRFAACPESPEDLITALDAVLSGQALRGRYRNLQGKVHDQHLLPLRLLLIDGEFHLLAWSSRQQPIKDFRLSRFLSLASDHRLPPQAPARDDPHLLTLIQRHREASFRSTGHTDLGRRQRITLLISPRAVPHLRDRVWGLEQRWEDNPAGQPPGCARLSFVSAGMAAVKHWILGQGVTVIVESPESLKQDIAREINEMRKRYHGKDAGRFIAPKNQSK